MQEVKTYYAGRHFISMEEDNVLVCRKSILVCRKTISMQEDREDRGRQ